MSVLHYGVVNRHRDCLRLGCFIREKVRPTCALHPDMAHCAGIVDVGGDIHLLPRTCVRGISRAERLAFDCAADLGIRTVVARTDADGNIVAAQDWSANTPPVPCTDDSYELGFRRRISSPRPDDVPRRRRRVARGGVGEEERDCAGGAPCWKLTDYEASMRINAVLPGTMRKADVDGLMGRAGGGLLVIEEKSGGTEVPRGQERLLDALWRAGAAVLLVRRDDGAVASWTRWGADTAPVEGDEDGLRRGIATWARTGDPKIFSNC